jgi:hypothetical protein
VLELKYNCKKTAREDEGWIENSENRPWRQVRHLARTGTLEFSPIDAAPRLK